MAAMSETRRERLRNRKNANLAEAGKFPIVSVGQEVVKRDAAGRTWKKLSKNSKGCDIGYALAANSCEGANNVDACTVTALDATTAFAVPDPGLPLAGSVGFFGSGSSADHSTEPSHSVYFGSATVYFD
jgi:hypothetical protein